MSREVDQDYQYVIQFFNQYSLKDMMDNPQCTKQIKCMHRKLYSLMVFINEVERIGCIDEISIKYFKEVSADLILAFFCWVNGIYKSAQLQMRSSIENYLKAIVYIDEPKIIEIKSVYEIFDIAETASGFKNAFCKMRYNILSSEYSNLCATVHGALDKLCNIGGLIKFPEYDEEIAKLVGDEFDKIVASYLSVIYFVYYDNIYQMHELNRDLFLQGLGKKDKAEIYNIK